MIHLLLILLFLTISATPEPLSAGYIEIEFGDFAEGRPVQKARTSPVDDEPEPVKTAEVRQQTQPEPSQDTKPVDLPDQSDIADEPEIRSPDAEEIQPEPADREPDPVDEAVIEAAPVSAAEGQTEGDSGNPSGVEGAGSDAEKAAPFVLEGIDRVPVRTQLPNYDEKVNAVIKVRITVDPNGRVSGVVPLQKANPTLEDAVMRAVRQWLFNPLGPGAPREKQTGTITFRFRLE